MGRNQRTVITGANSGIGLALLEQSIENEHDIIAVADAGVGARGPHGAR